MPKNKKISEKIVTQTPSAGKNKVNNSQTVVKNDYYRNGYSPLHPTSHPRAFKKLPYRVQHSRPLDYKYVDYDYAGYKCRQYGIKSARQYRAWQQSFKPAGFPSNPPRAYADNWINWEEFLQCQNAFAGYDPNTIKAAELLPYKDALIWTQSKQFPTVEDFRQAYDDGVMPEGMPRHPDKRYPEFYEKGGWKMFLGKKLEHRLDAKKELEPVCALCRTVGQSDNILTLVIDSQGANHLRSQLDKNGQLVPVKAYYWYHDFGMHVFELLNALGTKKSENSWLFPDLNLVFYELSSVLEEYGTK